MVEILAGLLGGSIIGCAFVFAELRAIKKRLDNLERVGVLITGKHAPETSARKMGRRELKLAIERRSMEKV